MTFIKLRQITNHKYSLAAIGLVLSAATQVAMIASAHAVFTSVLVRFDRLQTATTTTGMICATPATTGTEAKVLFVLPTGYSVSSSTANWTTGTTNNGWPTGATAWPGIGTATAVSGQTVTFPSGDLTVGTQYCFNWTNANAVTNGATGSSQAGTLTTQNSSNAQIDQSTYTTASVTNDQIQVTATVPQSFAFSLSSNTDNIGGASGLSTASVSSSPTPRTATVNTNSKNGWTVWAKDSSTGLFSTSANYTIPTTTPGTNSTLTSGTEGYNTGITSSQTSGTGVISIATPFVGGSTGKGGGLDTTYRPLATSNGPANGGTLTLTNNVAISPITPAATDYSDTITVVGAGLF